MAVSNSFDSVYTPAYFDIERAERVYVEVLSSTVNYGRNIVVLEAAGSDQPTIQDLGKRATAIRIDAILVDGRTFQDVLAAYGKAAQLEVAMNEEREGTFNHPTQGVFRVRIANIAFSDSNRQQGIIHAQMQLIVREERQAVPRFAQSSSRTLEDQASTLSNSARQRFEGTEDDGTAETNTGAGTPPLNAAQRFSQSRTPPPDQYVPPSNQAQQRFLANDVQGITNSISDSPIGIGGDAAQPWQRLSGIFGDAANLSDQVVDVLNTPGRFGRDAQLVFGNLQELDSPRDFAQSLFRIVTGLQGSTSPFGTLSRRLGLSRLLSLMGLYPIRELFSSRPSAENFIVGVTGLVAEEIASAPIELSEDLEAVQTTLDTYRREQLPALPEVRQVTYKEFQPALVLSNENYGNLGETDDIARGALHPFLVRDVEVRVS